jgi:hypothetical protein
VRFDSEARDPAVDHEIDVGHVVALTSRERFRDVEELSFQVVDDALHQLERDVVGVVDVDVSARLAQLDGSDCC